LFYASRFDQRELLINFNSIARSIDQAMRTMNNPYILNYSVGQNNFQYDTWKNLQREMIKEADAVMYKDKKNSPIGYYRRRVFIVAGKRAIDPRGPFVRIVLVEIEREFMGRVVRKTKICDFCWFEPGNNDYAVKGRRSFFAVNSRTPKAFPRFEELIVRYLYSAHWTRMSANKALLNFTKPNEICLTAEHPRRSPSASR